MFPNLSSLVRSLIKGSTFLLALVLLGVATACGATETPEPVQTLSPGTGGSGTEASSTPSADALQIFQSSFDAAQNLRSYRGRTVINTDALGETGTIFIDTEVTKNGRIRSFMTMDVLGEDQELESIMIQDKIFTKIPGLGWFIVSTESMLELTGQSTEALTDPTSFYNNLFSEDSIPWELYDVVSLGQEEVDGVPTEHLWVQVDYQQVLARMDDAGLDQFYSTFGTDGFGGLPELDEIEIENMEAWIDPDGFTRRTLAVMKFGESMSFDYDIHIFDINEDISIDLPTDFTDFDLFEDLSDFDFGAIELP